MPWLSGGHASPCFRQDTKQRPATARSFRPFCGTDGGHALKTAMSGKPPPPGKAQPGSGTDEKATARLPRNKRGGRAVVGGVVRASQEVAAIAYAPTMPRAGKGDRSRRAGRSADFPYQITLRVRLASAGGPQVFPGRRRRHPTGLRPLTRTGSRPCVALHRRGNREAFFAGVKRSVHSEQAGNAARRSPPVFPFPSTGTPQGLPGRRGHARPLARDLLMILRAARNAAAAVSEPLAPLARRHQPFFPTGMGPSDRTFGDGKPTVSVSPGSSGGTARRSPPRGSIQASFRWRIT